MAALEDSGAGRVIGALVSPVKTFRSIAERPTWAAALAVLLLASAAVGFIAGQRTDYRDVIVKSVQESGREIPADQLDRQIQVMTKAGPYFSGLGAPFVVVVFSLIAALLYWIFFKLLGSDFSYKKAFSVTLYAGMPAVVSLLLSLPVILSRSSLKYEDVKGGSFLQSNLSFLAPPGAHAWVLALYASADFFSLWSLVLAIVGFKAVSGLSTKAVAITVVAITLLFIGVRVGLAALR